MKIIKTLFLVFVLILLNASNAAAADMPTPETNASADDDCPACPPDQNQVPINQNITLLLIGGLVLGAFVVYNNKIKKASV
ncbi:hypothetical protein [Flavobacterium reichenbachii]|uniref:Signal peptidase n=1 Tax=Flavobacterium reichenbachii TaxID=362418 RepID=A0A085ZK99_9FLAO|nr:hypothetical protein [Flavobacterium reichenbachii]KFF04863.1 hypothetical protein IW19_04655 [Flavobacterium reichenbachii]OXB12150.1 hypothetical protein B0A68_19510 [Flavobacterium reichenbachii]